MLGAGRMQQELRNREGTELAEGKTAQTRRLGTTGPFKKPLYAKLWSRNFAYFSFYSFLS